MHPWLSRNENVSKKDVCMVDGGGVFYLVFSVNVIFSCEVVPQLYWLLAAIFISSYYVPANNSA